MNMVGKQTNLCVRCMVTYWNGLGQPDTTRHV